MSSEEKEPSTGEILTALQGMWRQQKDLVQGLEGRLGAKIEGVESALDKKLGRKIESVESALAATEQRLSDRLAQEIQDRPVVVHIDMSRVSDLEKLVQELARRVADLEARH